MKVYENKQLMKLFNQMSGAEKVGLAGYMTEECRRVLGEAIRIQHPRWSPQRRRAEVKRILSKLPG